MRSVGEAVGTEHARPRNKGKAGVLHGCNSMLDSFCQPYLCAIDISTGQAMGALKARQRRQGGQVAAPPSMVSDVAASVACRYFVSFAHEQLVDSAFKPKVPPLLLTFLLLLFLPQPQATGRRKFNCAPGLLRDHCRPQWLHTSYAQPLPLCHTTLSHLWCAQHLATCSRGRLADNRQEPRGGTCRCCRCRQQLLQPAAMPQRRAPVAAEAAAMAAGLGMLPALVAAAAAAAVARSRCRCVA